MNELETVETVVDSSNNVDVTVSGRGEVSTEIDNALDISVVKKEYKIVGDDVFIPTLYDDAPQWMKDLVQLAVDNAITVDKELLLNELISRLNDFATSYVPLNQYTQSILDLSNATESIHAFIETLNSNYNDGINNANAQIIELKHTKASSEEVVAKTIETLAAQLLTPSSQLGAVVAELREAVATTSSASAGIITNVNAKLADLDGDIQATANATTYLRSYVGIDDTGTATGTGLLANVEILQKQADGVINTYSNTYDVMLGTEDPNNNTDNDQLVTAAEPYASWLAEDTLNGNENVRLAHIGDVYIKYSNTTAGAKEYIASYKFIKTVVDSTSPYATDADGFTWALIIDQAAQDAYQQALKARDLADGKRRVFVGLGADSTPKVPYDQGDLWLIDATRVVNGYSCKVGDILRCVETKGEIGVYEQNDWVLASSYANAVDAQNQQFQNFVNTDYAVFATEIRSQVDKKAETFYQNSVPTGRIKATNVPDNEALNAYVGDLWKNILYKGTISGYLGENTEYIYTKTANGSNWDYDWVKMEVPDIVYDTIDTKKSIYSGNTVPVAVPPDVIKPNDMWITGDNPTSPYLSKSIYIRSGESWVVPVRYTDDQYAKDIENGTKQIDLSEHINSLGWTDDSTIDNFLTVTYAADKLNIQEQIDGKADTYYQDNEPYSLSSLSEAEKLARDGDVWYDTTPVSGVEAYRFSSTSGWVKIEDTQTLQALSKAATAQATADGKIQNFTSQPFTPYYIGDTWMQGATGGIYVCKTERLTGSFLESDWVIASNYIDEARLDDVKTSLQSQLDGKVDTYYQAAVPTGMTALNNGDYWYCTADVSTYQKGKVYKYVHTDTSWVETADVSRYAFDTANGKASIFSSTNPPTSGYKINDMLIVIDSFSNGTTTFADGVVLSSTANRTSGFTHADWVKRINDTEELDKFMAVIEPKVDTLQNQVDGQVNYYFYDSSIVGQTAASVSGSDSWTTDTAKREHHGDIAYNTYTKKGYWYYRQTGGWVEITGAQNAGLIEALNKAAEAKEAADTVIVSYYAQKQTTAPATSYKWMKDDSTLWEYVGSAWVPVNVKKDDTLTAYDSNTGDTQLYTYNGSGWITITPNGIIGSAKSVTELDTRLDGLNTTVSGHTTLLSTVDARIGAEGARVESNFAYNSNLKLNDASYSSGFGLATSVNKPNAGIPAGSSEFWVTADKFKVANSGATAGLPVFSIDGNNVVFNGNVTFAKVTGAPTVTQHSTFPGVNIGTGYTVTKAGVHVIYLYSTEATGLTIKANSTPIGMIASLNKQVLVFATPALPAGFVVTITANGTVVAYISNPDEIIATVPGTQWYMPAYSTTLVAGSNGQFVIGSSSATGDIIKGINGTTNTTTIDGGKITAKSITAGQIAANTITADRLNVDTLSAVSANLGTVNAGVMYNSGANESNYTMKIDLNTGEIHIK